jgi:hypothetical protein
MARQVVRKVKNVRSGGPVVPATNDRPRTVSPVPSRFTSTTEPVRISIVRAELSSVTGPTFLGNVFSNRRSVTVP